MSGRNLLLFPIPYSCPRSHSEPKHIWLEEEGKQPPGSQTVAFLGSHLHSHIPTSLLLLETQGWPDDLFIFTPGLFLSPPTATTLLCLQSCLIVVYTHFTQGCKFFTSLGSVLQVTTQPSDGMFLPDPVALRRVWLWTSALFATSLPLFDFLWFFYQTRRSWKPKLKYKWFMCVVDRKRRTTLKSPKALRYHFDYFLCVTMLFLFFSTVPQPRPCSLDNWGRGRIMRKKII